MKSQRKTTCGFDKGANWAWNLDGSLVLIFLPRRFGRRE
jgi:hypothetical protein